jgi:hypothetical protein
MAKKKLLTDILLNPPRFYRVPADVLRDRRFEDTERISILKAWAEAWDAPAADIAAALSELENRGVNGVNHVAQ